MTRAFRVELVKVLRRRVLILAAVAVVVFAVGGAAIVVAAAEPAATATPGRGVTLEALAGLGAGIADYGAVLFWVTGYAVLGMTVAVLIRSVPVALAAGIAWAGPFEHLLQDAWEPASRFFPGLLPEAFVAGGTPQVNATRAFPTIAIYAAAAAALAGTSFARRDAVG